MMITVAKSLDVPIKLVFPRPTGGPQSYAMVGLGDIVLPGIMIGLALRFDLYLHYLGQQTFTRTRNDEGIVKTEAQKAIWRPVNGRWADALWIHGVQPVEGVRRPSTEFAKPYFHSSLAGYLVGLITTIIAMHITKHGQPALLYLVPCVLLSLIFTALLRKETKTMWEFSEAIEEEAELALTQKAKEASEIVEEVKHNGVFSKLLSAQTPSKPKIQKAEKGKGVSTALEYANKQRSGSLSSSWGSASSSEPNSPVQEETKPFKPLPVRSPLMLRSVKEERSIHGDANTLFSITLSFPTNTKASEPKNWKETAKGDEVLAPSGKRQRTAL